MNRGSGLEMRDDEMKNPLIFYIRPSIALEMEDASIINFGVYDILCVFIVLVFKSGPEIFFLDGNSNSGRCFLNKSCHSGCSTMDKGAPDTNIAFAIASHISLLPFKEN